MEKRPTHDDLASILLDLLQKGRPHRLLILFNQAPINSLLLIKRKRSSGRDQAEGAAGFDRP